MKETNTFAFMYRSVVLTILALGLFFGTIGLVLAQEEVYFYVNETGQLETEVAATPTEAINTPSDIKHNSGVILAEEYYDLLAASDPFDSDTNNTADGENLYAYIATDGDMEYIAADTPTEAINGADNIKYNSGVQLVNE